MESWPTRKFPRHSLDFGFPSDSWAQEQLYLVLSSKIEPAGPCTWAGQFHCHLKSSCCLMKRGLNLKSQTLGSSLCRTHYWGHPGGDILCPGTLSGCICDMGGVGMSESNHRIRQDDRWEITWRCVFILISPELHITQNVMRTVKCWRTSVCKQLPSQAPSAHPRAPPVSDRPTAHGPLRLTPTISEQRG